MRSRRRFFLVILVAVVVLLGLGVFGANRLGLMAGPSNQGASVAADEWPTYMYDAQRSGFNRGEVRLSPDNAANLKLLWKRKIGDIIAAQPIVKGDTVYLGAWDGFLYALNTEDGAVKWKVDLGRTNSRLCVPETAGITSAPVVTDKAIYIGGGDDHFYALDPQNGNTLWKVKSGDNSETGGAYNWASPLLYKDKVYYGSSSFCDKPFTHAELWSMKADNGNVEQRAGFIPKDQRGGGIWTSPTVDEATGDIYVTIGSGDYYIQHNYSIARLHPQTLQVVDAWQVPIEVQVFDGDWGTTPTLFRDRDGKLMVAAAAKNGYYYAFKADQIHKGPAWSARIADGGQCPQCGEGAISTSVYAYDTIYVGAGYYSLGQVQKFAGTVHALDPTTGAVKWLHPTNGWVIPALAAANGLVVAAGDDTVEVIHAGTGDLLWEYATGATIYAAPTIAGGVLYVASTDGYLYAFSAGPYPDGPTAYKLEIVGTNPPNFTPFRTPMPAPKMQGAEQCFSDTRHCARGAFLDFWNANGGLERFGPAVTDELSEAGRTVQYFRNAVLEIGPDPDEKGAQIRMGKLDFRLFYYTPENDHFGPADPLSSNDTVKTTAETDEAISNTEEVGDQPFMANRLFHEDEPAESSPTRPSQPITGSVFFPETRHNLYEPFLSYWRAHGEVAGLGYPVSEPFDEYSVVDGEARRVQYFERSRLEIVKEQDGTERVVLGALGLQRYMQRYGKLP